MAKCKNCTAKGNCKRHKRKSKASSVFVASVTFPPPYANTFETTRPDEVAVCEEKVFSFAQSNLGGANYIGTEVGVRHRIIVKDNNNSIKLDATFTVGTHLSLSDITVGSLSMVVAWFENDAIVVLNPSLIIPQSSGVMSHFVEYLGTWSVNVDETTIQRWQVDFIYDPPASISLFSDSLWVDDGCTIDFSAQNNIDERVIETVTQINNVDTTPSPTILTPTSGVPTNLAFTSNPIISTTNIKIQVGAFAPRFTIDSSGAEGYLKVEWNDGTSSQVDYISPNTRRSYIIGEGIIIKVTAAIVDFTTGELDEDRVDISLPNYKFPPRIQQATLNGLSQVGVSSSSIPSENGVDRAIEFDVVMQNTDIEFKVFFQEIDIFYDYDFANPICVDNATTTVTTIKSRIDDNCTISQNTPSQRPDYIEDGIRVSNEKRIEGYFITPAVEHHSSLIVARFAGQLESDLQWGLKTIVRYYRSNTATSASPSINLAGDNHGGGSLQTTPEEQRGKLGWVIVNELGPASTALPKKDARELPARYQKWSIISNNNTHKAIYEDDGQIYDASLSGDSSAYASHGIKFGNLRNGYDSFPPYGDPELIIYRAFALKGNLTNQEEALLLQKVSELYNI